MSAHLSSAELARYSRHVLIPEVGRAGQERLKSSSVLLVGTGALGSPTAMYLAAAGVGRLGLVDDDVVDVSNLQRQILHGESWVGKAKLDSAAARLAEINPHVALDLHRTRLTPDIAMSLAADYDVIVDGSDNFPTRFLTNDTAFFLRKPLVYGAIHRFEGQCSVFAPHLGGPCYRCLLPVMPSPGSVPSCAEAGVLGVLPGIIGSMQAMETIKLLLGIGTPPLGSLLLYDGLQSRVRSLRLARDPHCRLCGTQPSIVGVHNAETLASSTCSLAPNDMESITVEELQARMHAGLDGVLVDVRQPEEYVMAAIAGSQLIPLATLGAHVDSLPRDQKIYLYCKAGIRSARAAQFLQQHGITQTVNVEGGMDAWLDAGLPYQCDSL